MRVLNTFGLAALACFIHAIAMAQPGSAGMPLLKLGIGARTVALGYSSLATEGPNAIGTNPAGVHSSSDTLHGVDLVLSHQEWVQDARTEFLGASLPLGAQQTLALSVLTQTVSDIEIRTKPGAAEGTFTSRDLAAGLTYARAITPTLRAGMTARFLYQELLSNEATGYSFDFGVRSATPVEGLEVGAALMNLGRMSILQLERTKLPALFRAGAAYSDTVSSSIGFTLTGDAVRNFPEKRFYASVGGECLFQQLIALRLGNEFGSDARGFTAGLGLTYGIFTLDYALGHLREDLGTAHTVTLGIGL